MKIVMSNLWLFGGLASVFRPGGGWATHRASEPHDRTGDGVYDLLNDAHRLSLRALSGRGVAPTLPAPDLVWAERPYGAYRVAHASWGGADPGGGYRLCGPNAVKTFEKQMITYPEEEMPEYRGNRY